MPLQAMLESAIQAAKAAGSITLEYFGTSLPSRLKKDHSPVTDADVEADDCLRERLLAAYPDFGWLSEETVDSPRRRGRRFVWVVDPLDGTSEFVHHRSEYAISVALVEDGTPLLGVVHAPVLGETYAAVRSGGLFLNGRRVFAPAPSSLAQATVVVSNRTIGDGRLRLLAEKVREVQGVGSMAYRLARVAAGKAQISISLRPKNEWDVCAGDLLLRESGCLLRDLRGEPVRYNQEDPRIPYGLVAASPNLVPSVRQLIPSRPEP